MQERPCIYKLGKMKKNWEMKRDKMGHRCCGKHKVKRGLWSPEEDEKLLRYITTHGHPSWSSVPKLAGFISSLFSLSFS